MGGWDRFIVAGLIAGTALIGGTALGARAQEAAPASVSACRFEVVGGGKVAQVINGATFVLEDGREVRLAAVEVPPLPAPGERGDRASAGIAAKAALEAILAGASVELRQHGAVTDRYGRTLAFAYLTRDGAERSAAHDLLAQGFARVTAHVGNAACAAELFSRERVARTAHVGLWADSRYAIVGAESFAELLAEQGHFAVVEGKVLSVRESGGTIYMNFGRRWSQALTVTILKRHERIFVGAGLQPKKLENRRVRVRGWVEERNGPRIEATRPEQIELAERN
jgi:endonuclease YncB( thermonuclease family)